MNNNLKKAYGELQKNGFTFDQIVNRDKRASRILFEVENEFKSWKSHVQELTDFRNWNTENLSLEEPERVIRGNIPHAQNLRRPRAYFLLYIKSGVNLTLDWYPHHPEASCATQSKADWLNWDTKSPVGITSYPFNRVMMIRNFTDIRRSWNSNSYNEFGVLILEAIKDLINEIYLFLDSFVEIHKVTDLYLQYEMEQFENKLISFAIQNVRETLEEMHIKKKLEWIKKNCDQFGITTKMALESFKANDMKYATTVRALFPKGKGMTNNRFKKLIHLLYELSDSYDSITDNSPPDIKALN